MKWNPTRDEHEYSNIRIFEYFVPRIYIRIRIYHILDIRIYSNIRSKLRIYSNIFLSDGFWVFNGKKGPQDNKNKYMSKTSLLINTFYYILHLIQDFLLLLLLLPRVCVCVFFIDIEKYLNFVLSWSGASKFFWVFIQIGNNVRNRNIDSGVIFTALIS